MPQAPPESLRLYLFELDVPLKLELKNLPVIGDKLPAELQLGIENLQVIPYNVPENCLVGFYPECNVLMPLLLEAGEEGGFENLVWHKIHLRSGIYLFKGALTNFHLSQRFDLKYTDLNLLIASQR